MTSFSRVLGVLSERWRKPDTCEACGNEFTCGAALTGCWCAEVRLTKTVRTGLRQQYKKCLCRTCLERQATQEDV